MPHLKDSRSQGEVKDNSKTGNEIKNFERDRARDHIGGNFAGKENQDSSKSSHLKSRATENSKTKTPIR